MVQRVSHLLLGCLCLVASGCGKKKPAPRATDGIDAGSAAATTMAADANATAAPPATTVARAHGGAGPGSEDAVTQPAPATEDATLGLNLALAALGGHIISPQEPKDRDRAWRVANLLDGFPVIRGFGTIESSLGWQPETQGFPHELVLAFHGDRKAVIAAVVIDTASNNNVGNPAAIPRDVEVYLSTTSATAGFSKIATATLPSQAGETVLRFAPTPASFVKLVIASTHDSAPSQLGEIQIYEAAGATSIVDELAKNLLLPALGGNLVRFTSQLGDGLAAELFDGVVDERAGWSSLPTPDGTAARLPQELTFGFRDHRSAFIDRVVIHPTSGMRNYNGPLPNLSTWAKTIEVQTSELSPWQGFTTVSVLAVPSEGPAVGKPLQVPIGKTIRFLRLRVLENQGGDRVTLGEVEAFEGAAPAGRSILVGRSSAIAQLAASPIGAGAETAARREREPNNSQKEADPVDSAQPIGGALQPAGDRDVFRIAAGPGPGTQTLTVAIEGRPAIRSRLTVIDSAGISKYELDPSRIQGPTARFSVVTQPGDLFLQIVQPPAAQVVIWDSSGSMEHRVTDLDAALRDYLGQIEPDDRVQLIRFDNSIEVLLKDFSGRKNDLLAALKDKVYADGGTSIYDAIGKGIETMSKVSGSRAIVMMTDGEDTTSQTDPSEFWRALDNGRVRLYAIGLGNGLRNFVPRAGATAERVLGNAALATGGRYQFVADSAKLAALYAEIGAELRAPASYALSASVSSATGTIAVKSTGEQLAVPPRVELVLDASGSMKRKMAAPPGGKAKLAITMMDAAKGALDAVVAALPASAQVALRVYGHRTAEKRAGACEDSELVVPFGPLDRSALLAKIRRIKALGTTPIAYSIRAAGDDLKDASGAAMLVVVTDGREECGGDPVAAVTALRASGIDVTVNVVGFGLTDPADRIAMGKVAAAGGGRFFDAQGARELRAAIDQALAVPYLVVDAAGVVVARGMVGGEPVVTPAGEFAIRIDSTATAAVIEHVVVDAGKATWVELKKDGDDIGARIGAPGRIP